MQALMLAAGMGKRLGKYTNGHTKCMVKVGGKTLLEHTVDALKYAGIQKFVVVVGYQGEKLVEYINQNITGIDFTFVYNRDFENTNNIYSLYLAREHLAQDDTIMVESDLIYDKTLIKKIVDFPHENAVAVAHYEQWMDGTVTLLDEEDNITEFVEKKDFHFENADTYYKTVNVYKFSKEFSQKKYLPFLDAYIQAYGKNQYYELVLKAIAHLSYADLKAYKLHDMNWYEIDDAQDLDIANTLFADDGEKQHAYGKHFGGFWRFPGLKDFCYLVNPYFPPKALDDKIKYFFNRLIAEYPSGMYIQQINAGRMFGVDEENILVGNGAAEIISALGRLLKGKMAVSLPSFYEYIRCFENCEITRLYTAQNDFLLDKQALLHAAQTHDVLAIINPDNPSGSFLSYEDMTEILDVCEARGTCCIVDESFIDFADSDVRYTLIDDAVLQKYKSLIVIKSISKSYGVPGLRLGVVAAYDKALLAKLKDAMAIWNINSFAEYFLQIITLYTAQYKAACNALEKRRHELAADLQDICFLQPYPSQANYIMCRITGQFTAAQLTEVLLKDFNLIIKDLSTKEGFDGENFIRISVRDEKDNAYLVAALKKLEQ